MDMVGEVREEEKGVKLWLERGVGWGCEMVIVEGREWRGKDG